MRSFKLFQNWDATIRIATLVAFGLVLSLVINVLLSIKLVRSMERLVLMPANLVQSATITRTDASKSYLESWALYFTTVLGSVTPSNAQSIADYLGRNVDQNIWHAVRAQVLSVVDDPQYNRQGAFNMFVPKAVIYEPDTNKTFVHGKLTTLSYRTVGLAVSIDATYELVIDIRDGQPIVASLDSYPGAPRTELWLAKNPTIIVEEKKVKATAAAQALIRRDELVGAQTAAEEVARKTNAAKAADDSRMPGVTDAVAPIKPPATGTGTALESKN